MSLNDKYIVPSSPGFNSIFSDPDLRLYEGNIFILGKHNKVSNPRLGVSIKKRDYKLAVHRNFLKRKIKSNFSKYVDKLPHMDFVVVVGPGEYDRNKKDYLGSLWNSFAEDHYE